MAIQDPKVDDSIQAAIKALSPSKRQKVKKLFRHYYDEFIAATGNDITVDQLISALRAQDPDFAMSNATFGRHMDAETKRRSMKTDLEGAP